MSFDLVYLYLVDFTHMIVLRALYNLLKEQENYLQQVGNDGYCCCDCKVTSHSWDIFWHFYKVFEMQSKASTSQS